MSKKLEEKLIGKIEEPKIEEVKELSESEKIDKQIDDLLNKKYDLKIEEAKAENKPLQIDDLKLLKFHVSKDGFGNKLVDAECFSSEAIYSVFNFKTKTPTIMNGAQIDSLFGLNDETRLNFARGEFGKSYAIGNFRFTFKYLEREV